MTVLLSHPTGNANIRQLALALAEAGWLQGMVTGLAVGPEPAATMPGWHLLPARLQRELLRRRWPAAVAPRLQCHPLPDLLRLLPYRSGLFRGTGVPSRLSDWHYRWHDRHVATHHLKGGLRAVIAAEDAATATLQAARRRGLHTVLELPTLHHAWVGRWHRQEAARHPAYRALLPAVQEPPAKLKAKQAALEAAELVLVPSQLVFQSCVAAGIPPERLRVVPYGAPDAVDPACAGPESRDPSTPVVLYVGRVTPAKGIDDLVEAWRQLPDRPPWRTARLWLVGLVDYPSSWQQALPASVRCFGSIPFHELKELYRRAWIFAMPSLVDGLPLVCLEAMAAGLPVLITERCGVQDRIDPGVNGWITPAAQPEALAALLTTLLADPSGCRRAGSAACATARAHTWEHYRRQVRATLAPWLA